MKRLPVFIFLFVLSTAVCGQDSDTIRYRSTSFHGSVSDFILISPAYSSYGGFFPSAALSLKSGKADSLYRSKKALNFSIMVGAAGSRYLFFQEEFFRNFLDKHPFHVLSKRFWGGFGINYRKQLSEKFVFDVDLMPCIQVNVDKSEETKTDTSGWNSVGYESIYQGIHLNAYCKLEYKLKGDFSPFLSVSAALPLTHTIARDPMDEPYHNVFKGQLFVGIGVSYYYKSRHIVDPGEKKQPKP